MKGFTVPRSEILARSPELVSKAEHGVEPERWLPAECLPAAVSLRPTLYKRSRFERERDPFYRFGVVTVGAGAGATTASIPGT